MLAEQDTYFSYTGNGVTTEFIYGCRIFKAADLVVTVAGAVKALAVDYTLTGIDADGGGTVTFLAGKIPANGELVELERILSYARDTSYIQNGGFRPDTVDHDQDYQTALIQQMNKNLVDKALLSDTVGGNYNALMRQIENVGDAIKATDAVNYQSLTTEVMRVAMSIATGQIAGVLARGYASMNAAVNAIGANETTLFVDTTTVLTGACTIPCNVNLVVAQSGLIDTAGYGLIVNGPFTGSQNQAFAGAGQVTFGVGSVLYIIPNWWKGTETDDSTSINKAIKCAVQDNSGCLKVLLPQRWYSIDNPIEIWKWNGSAFSYVVAELAGLVKGGYSGLNLNTKITTTYNDRPAIFLQKARGVAITSIALEGIGIVGSDATWTMNKISDPATDWAGSCRDDRYSPYSGICIDPFGTALPATGGGYPGYSSYQTAGNNASGSSACMFENIQITKFVVGLMASPSGITAMQNCENMYCNNFLITYCKTFISIGQDQSRHFTVKDFSGYMALTAFDSLGYGKQRGNPPVVDTANIGMVKELYNKAGWNFGECSFRKIYGELIFSISSTGGVALVNSDIRFTQYSASNLYCPEFHDVNAKYINCFLSYGTNLYEPFVLSGLQNKLQDTTMDGLAVVDSLFHNTLYENCWFSYQPRANIFGPYSTSGINMQYLSNVNSQVVLPLMKINGLDTYSPKAEISPHNMFVSLGSLEITKVGATATFTVANGEILRVGDWICKAAAGGSTPLFRGVVTTISGNDITINRIPYALASATESLWVWRPRRLHQYNTGDVTSGNKVIANCNHTSYWTVNDPIYGAGIPVGAYVTAKDATTITVSATPTATASGVSLYDAAFTQSTDSLTTTAPVSGVWPAGARGNRALPVAGSPYAWLCTVSGEPGTWVALPNLGGAGETVLTGTAAPVVTPTFIGQRFIDTTANKVYIAEGVASSADWIVVN